MSVPLEIKFRHADRSEALEAEIRKHVDQLAQQSDRIMRCEVVITAPHKHKHKGSPYEVGIHLDLAGGTAVVSGEGDRNPAHEDVYVAVRDAFKAIKRQLQSSPRGRELRD